jgi:NADH-ubiquinone oxidoreductase chain 5
MLILVTANNFLQMFVGWEGVGLSSYLLINFWFTRIQANKSSIKAMLINRIGDFFILLGIFFIYFLFNSLDYDIIFNLSKISNNSYINFFYINVRFIDIICCFLFFGCMGKSAQIGLHVWLPDAMEGPTPVSALIHAATMVTAGVFLIARCSFIFEQSSFILTLIILVGSITSFFASTTGLFQNDIKKVIAYSTCSQLGYMIFACGLSSYDVGIFHLFNHAFFKALLFLGAGSIIHGISNEQDMRRMGGLKQVLPFSYSVMFIGSLALTGFPFLSGFYSKDVILEVAFSKYTNIAHFSYILGTIAAFFTAFYSTRLLFLVFLIKPNGNKNILITAHESLWKMQVPLLLLSFLSIFVGFFAKDLLIGFGTDFWVTSLFIFPNNYSLNDVEFLSLTFKLMPLLATLLGIVLSSYIYILKLDEFFTIKQNKNFKKVYNFFNRKWYFDKFYNTLISQPVIFLGYFFSYGDIDRGILESFGPHGIINIFRKILNDIKFYQSGQVLNYLFFFFIIFVIFIPCLLFII